MSSKPDEDLLALWLEDELEPADREAVERWVAGREDWLTWRRETREWKEMMRRALPDEQVPPACEFFDARIRSLVDDAGGDPAPAHTPVRRSAFGWKATLAAAAGMVLCFWAGTRFGPTAAPSPGTVAAAPAVYTPEQGVEARIFESESAEAMVIVLDGVAAIPDSFEIPDRAAHPDEPTSWMAAAGNDGPATVQ